MYTKFHQDNRTIKKSISLQLRTQYSKGKTRTGLFFATSTKIRFFTRRRRTGWDQTYFLDRNSVSSSRHPVYREDKV